MSHTCDESIGATVRRANYDELLGEQEYFVTPLIRRTIQGALDKVGAPAPGAIVLDIGAGECPLRENLEQRGYSYQSLDIEQNSKGTIDYVARIDEPLPEVLRAAGSFDLLVLTEVLEHVPDWGVAFDNLAALLKPGGRCIVTVPFFYMLHEEPHDYWRPTDHAVRHYAISRGLNVVETRRTGDGWDVLGTLLCSTSVCRRKKSPLSYVGLAPVWLGHKFLKWFFTSRLLWRSVDFRMRYYMGNYFMLEKRGA